MNAWSPNRLSGLPVHMQVKRELESRISNGQIGGGRLPAERMLSESLGVSRVTLRRALAALADEGTLAPTQTGRGWLVARSSLSDPPNTLVSFSTIARERGLTPTSQVLAAATRRAAPDEAEQLEVAPGAPVFELERLRLLDGVAVGLDRSILTSALIPIVDGVVLRERSLYETLEAAGIVPTRADYVVEADQPSQREAELLRLAENEPLIVLRQLTFDEHERPIELGRMAYPSSIYRFRATMFRRGSRGMR
jgi:GntR family transcriptional regulator